MSKRNRVEQEFEMTLSRRQDSYVCTYANTETVLPTGAKVKEIIKLWAEVFLQHNCSIILFIVFLIDVQEKKSEELGTPNLFPGRGLVNEVGDNTLTINLGIGKKQDPEEKDWKEYGAHTLNREHDLGLLFGIFRKVASFIEADVASFKIQVPRAEM